MEPIDINSQTRADCHGMRPDLYAALSGNMVRKEDISAVDMSSGYITIGYDPAELTKISTPLQNGTERYQSKNAHMEKGKDKFGDVCIKMVFDQPGIWITSFKSLISRRVQIDSPGKVHIEPHGGAKYIKSRDSEGDNLVIVFNGVELTSTLSSVSGMDFLIVENPGAYLTVRIRPGEDGRTVYAENTVLTAVKVA